MNRRTFRKQQKAIRRRNAKQAFIVPHPEKSLASAPPSPEVTSAPVQTTITAKLTPAQRIILQELHRFQLDLNKLFLRASQRMMVLGMNESRKDSSVK
jgi:hypothetical protein